MVSMSLDLPQVATLPILCLHLHSRDLGCISSCESIFCGACWIVVHDTACSSSLATAVFSQIWFKNCPSSQQVDHGQRSSDGEPTPRPTAKARPATRPGAPGSDTDDDDSPTGHAHTPVPPATGSITTASDASTAPTPKAPKTSSFVTSPATKAKAAIPSYKVSGPPPPDPAGLMSSSYVPPPGSWPYTLMGAGGGGVHVYFPPYTATPALPHIAGYEYTFTLAAKAIPPKAAAPKAMPPRPPRRTE